VDEELTPSEFRKMHASPSHSPWMGVLGVNSRLCL
jgi:hypothetical protein